MVQTATGDVLTGIAMDIMPTLLEFCGLPVPAGVEGQRLPFKPEDKRRSFVYSEYGAGEPEYTWEDARKSPSRTAPVSANFKETAA